MAIAFLEINIQLLKKLLKLWATDFKRSFVKKMQYLSKNG